MKDEIAAACVAGLKPLADITDVVRATMAEWSRQTEAIIEQCRESIRRTPIYLEAIRNQFAGSGGSPKRKEADHE